MIFADDGPGHPFCQVDCFFTRVGDAQEQRKQLGTSSWQCYRLLNVMEQTIKTLPDIRFKLGYTGCPVGFVGVGGTEQVALNGLVGF